MVRGRRKKNVWGGVGEISPSGFQMENSPYPIISDFLFFLLKALFVNYYLRPNLEDALILNVLIDMVNVTQ